MPINDKLPNLENPVTRRTGEQPVTLFHEHLTSINVSLLQSPSLNDLLAYVPRWAGATWSDKPHNQYTPAERYQYVEDMFKGDVLPSALESVNLIFLVSNIDLVDVTHLLRHRTMSFSAICTADRDLRHDACMVKASILDKKSEDFYRRYRDLVKKCKELYADMVDSDEISLLDARTILPRCLENHYYFRVNLKDAIHYMRQRLDRQIQPESDNIVAIQMLYRMCEQFPMMVDVIDLEAPDAWYVKTAPTGRSSNIYMPEIPRNDVFDYKDQWFLYKKQRKDMRGGEVFLKLWDYWAQQIKEIKPDA